ncbi:MAG: glycosyltransferase family 4 protein [Chloroflexi bacterium]|nr:glycosyltransferase family 4 protein [Chloroflexota bacterium]
MSEKRKIAVVAACPFPYPRGTPLRILRMAEALIARGHEVHVVTYHLGQKMDGLPFPIHRIPQIATYHKYSPGPTYQKVVLLDTLLSRLLFKVVREQQVDLIHAHHYEGMLASLPVARLARIPLVFDIHTLLSTELPHYPVGLPASVLRRLGNLFDHWLPPKADHIVAVTKTIRERLISEIGIPESRVTTVYTGIEADHFAARPDSLSETESTSLIYDGNLAPYQGIDLMLRAFRRVLDRRPSVTLKLITNSPLASYSGLIDSLDLKRSLEILPADYFKLPYQLHSAMIALSPRVECDGLPLKVLNYMATGRAIVAFEGSAEILVHEKTGLVIPNGDVEAFASSILRLLDEPDLARRLGAEACSNVMEFFIWEDSVKLLEEIYARVLRNK